MHCRKDIVERLVLSSLSSRWLWYKVTGIDRTQRHRHTTHIPLTLRHTGHSFLATRFRFWKTLLVEEFIAEEFKALRERRVRRKVRNELEKTLRTGFHSGKNTTQEHTEQRIL